MPLPNFFIVGSPKCGTTSLYYHLNQHPEIFMSAVKEPHYFTGYGRYKDNPEAYEALFSGWKGEKAVGEASASYLYSEQATSRIKELVPEARIIIILRNPAQMAHAYWRHNVRKRKEDLSFPEALRDEPRRMAGPAFIVRPQGSRGPKGLHADYCYFNRALYSPQVKRYIDAFGRDRVKVLIFEEFVRDPLMACREVFKFLGVDPGFRPSLEKHNVAYNPRHRGLEKLLTRPPHYLSGVRGLLPDRVVRPVRDFLLRLNNKPEPRLDDELRKSLLTRFRPDIHKLERLIGRDLSHWYKELG